MIVQSSSEIQTPPKPSGSTVKWGKAPTSSGCPACRFWTFTQSMRTVVQKSISSWTAVG